MDLDLDNCVIRNVETGEETSLDAIMVKDGGKFEKVFKEELASMIGCAGNRSEAVIAWLLKNKNSKNEIYGTHRSIQKETGVSLPTVTKVLKKLKDGGFIKTVRTGVLLLDPKVIYYGSEVNKMFILKIWKGLD